MKRTIKPILALVLLGMFIYSCKKDKNDTAGSFTHDGKEYSLSKGTIENYGLDGNAYNIDLTMYSSGLKLYESYGIIDSIGGKGHLIYFEIYTSKPDQLDNATYTFDEASLASGTFDYGLVYKDADFTNETGTELEIIAGSVTIAKSGSTYDISFDFTTSDNKNIKGSYKGSLKYYNYDLQKAIKVPAKKPLLLKK